MAETHFVNLTAAVVQLMSNIVTNSNGLMTSFDVTDASAWNLTDLFCQSMDGTINTYTTGDLAESAAVDGDVIMVTSKIASQGDLILHQANSFNAAWATTKNITFRSPAPTLKWHIIIGGNITSNSVSGVAFEDAFIANVSALRASNLAEYRRCYFANGAAFEAGLGGTPGDLKTYSCIFEDVRSLFNVNGTTNGHEHYHMSYLSTRSSAVAIIPVNNTCVIANGIFLIEDPAFDMFAGAGDYTGTTNNWTNQTGSLQGSGNLVGKDADDLKLSAFNNVTPPQFLLPSSAITPGLSSEIEGKGITIAAAHTLTENRRDFMGNVRPTAGLQDMGSLNVAQDHDGGVKALGYSAADVIVTNTLPITATVVIS